MRSCIDKFDTVGGKVLTIVTKCKLLFAKSRFVLLSTEVFCDDILAGVPYRLLRCERLSAFDLGLLPRLVISERGAQISAVIVYAEEDGAYRFAASRVCGVTAYAAVALALFYNGRLDSGERVSISSGDRTLFAAVTEDGVLLFD